MKATYADLMGHTPLIRRLIKYGIVNCAVVISEQIGMEVNADTLKPFCKKMGIVIPDQMTCLGNVRKLIAESIA